MVANTPSRADFPLSSDGHAHFYLDSEFDYAAMFDWDPDADPTRFASGLGHNFLELFIRLRTQGHSVSIGPDVPAATTVIVVFPGREIWKFRRHLALCWSVRRHHCVIIRSDLDLRFGRIIAHALQIVANPVIAKGGRRTDRIYLPPLPQRGLRPRGKHARASSLVMTYKGNPLNVPEYLTQEWFLAEMAEINVDLHLDVPLLTDGSDQTWHDFSGADLALLDRRDGTLATTSHKPPTKLLNAWSADVIPIYAPEPAYVCLSDPGHDSLQFEGPLELLAILRQLTNEPGTVVILRAGVRDRRASLPSTQEIVDNYWAAIQSRAARPSKLLAIAALPTSMSALAYVRALRILDRVRTLWNSQGQR